MKISNPFSPPVDMWQISSFNQIPRCISAMRCKESVQDRVNTLEQLESDLSGLPFPTFVFIQILPFYLERETHLERPLRNFKRKYIHWSWWFFQPIFNGAFLSVQWLFFPGPCCVWIVRDAHWFTVSMKRSEIEIIWSSSGTAQINPNDSTIRQFL